MIYFDNSATTEISALAKTQMIDAIGVYGNPSSTHKLGIEAAKLISDARDKVAMALGIGRAMPENLIFTSCGSEANNTAILGSVFSKEKRRGNKIITTDSEHSSVENVMKRLEKEGFEVVRLKTLNGVIDEEQMRSELDDKTLLVSLMMVNNETGAAYDVKRLFDMTKRLAPNAVTHCDAVQGFLKIPFNARSLGADLISISAHKIHGPKGVGALYISPDIIKTKKIIPYIIGGGQEGGYRSGTENIVGIVGLGAAAEEGRARFSQNSERMIKLRDMCESGVRAAGARPNIPAKARAPHVLSVTLPDIKSETMLNYLSSKGICISAGSACSAHSRHMSSSLIGFGLAPEEADCTVRISFSEYNTEDELELFLSALKDGIDSLVRIKR